MSHKNAFLSFPFKSSHKIGCFWTQISDAAAFPLCTDYLSTGLTFQPGLARGWPVSTTLLVQLPATLTHVCLLPGPWRHWVLQPVAYKTVEFTQVHNMVWRTRNNSVSCWIEFKLAQRMGLWGLLYFHNKVFVDHQKTH